MAKKQNRITQLRQDVDRLRKNYTGAMSSANKAVYDGIDKLAEHELKAIKQHYEAALKNLKQLRKGGDARDIASAQLKLLQETIDRIMSNARESLKILDNTRKQIAKDIRKNINTAQAPKPAAKTGTARSSTAGKKKTATAAKKPAARKTAARKSSTAGKTAAAKKTTARKSAGGAKKKAATSRKKTGTARAKSSTSKANA